MPRFTVEQTGKVFWIKDNQAEEFHMPERAVAINFKAKYRATTVCNILDAEWTEFERNPE